MFFVEDLPTRDQETGVETHEYVGSGAGGEVEGEEEEDVGVRYERVVKQKTHKAQIEPVSCSYIAIMFTLYTHTCPILL